MAIEKVKSYFRKYNMEQRILEFDVSSATVELAAQALNCESCRIAKTLSFMVNEIETFAKPLGWVNVCKNWDF